MDVFILFIVLVPILSAGTLFYLIIHGQSHYGLLILLGAIIPIASLLSALWLIEGRKKKK
jgi:hypothetical protein